MAGGGRDPEVAAEQRAHLRDHGFVICRDVVPADWLPRLRASYERLIELYRCESPRGQEWWETHSAPRLHLSYSEEGEGSVGCGSLVTPETAAAVEFWCHESFHGLSSRLLGVEDASVASMVLMCEAREDHGPGLWHRDFFPPRCAPLQSYHGDISESGPRYIQWNLALHDDEVLWVVPGTHVLAASTEQDACLRQAGLGGGRGEARLPLPGAVQVKLRAGDGVAYTSPGILHWGSSYGTKLRRTIHGGYTVMGYNDSLHFMPHISKEAQACFRRWEQRNRDFVDREEGLFRSVLSGACGTPQQYDQALAALVPSHSTPLSRRHSAICLSKAARRIYYALHPEEIPAPDPDHDPPGASPSLEAGYVDVGTRYLSLQLQPGRVLYDRFSKAEAAQLWAYYRHVDAALQQPELGGGHGTAEGFGDLNWEPGFQGGPTPYTFHALPCDDDAHTLGPVLSEREQSRWFHPRLHAAQHASL